MAMSSAIAALLKPQADRGRNQFPLDNKQVYSMKAGQITPVNTFHFMPGDFLKMKVADFALTFPMQTAPFLRGRKEFSFYTVYYNAIWSLFNQYQAGRSDPKTSAFTLNSVTNTEPRIRLSQLYFAIFEQWCYYIYDNYTWDTTLNAHLLLRDAWRNEAKSSFLTIDITNQFDINNQLDDLNTAWLADSYNTTVSYNVPNTSTNKDFMFDVVGQYRVYNWCRKLDMLGYGNIYPILSKYERRILDDQLAYTRTNGVLDTHTADALDDYFTGCFREIELACVNVDNNQAKFVNMYAICAYNSVFYHFFRNSYFDLDYSPRNYNLDFLSISNTMVAWMSDFDYRFLDIEYHQWKKDMFTAVLPDTQFGAVSSISFNADVVSDFISNSLRYPLYTGNEVVDSRHPQFLDNGVYKNATLHVDSSFDVIALKRAEMLQDYRQTIMRAGNKTSDVFRAIYGGAPSSEHEDDVIPRFLDTFGIDIFVDPVTATADTGSGNPNGSLGDIAARGKFRGDSGTIKFNAGNNFGVLLTLAYVVPTAEYNSYMLDKHNLELTPEDHFIPQFENLGLEPIYSDELNGLNDVRNVAVLGYGPRYHHKKCAVDKVHGAFCSKYPRLADITGVGELWYGDFNHWVSPRTELQMRTHTQIKDFYINPSVLDNVFVQAAGADLSQDQFLCNTFFEMATTREMSKVGLINFV